MDKAKFVARLRHSGVVVTKNGGAHKPIDLIVNSAKAQSDLKIISQIRKRNGA